MKRITLYSIVVLALGAAAPVSADGPPVTSLPAGPGGVVEQDGRERFVALPAAMETIVAMSRVRGGQVSRAVSLEGALGRAGGHRGRHLERSLGRRQDTRPVLCGKGGYPQRPPTAAGSTWYSS